MKAHTFAAPACLLACLGCPCLAAGEDEHRDHDSHKHGAAEMNLAVDGTQVMIELDSPAVNIVGFEHTPQSEDQRNQVKQAIQRLEAAEDLFVFSPGVRCQLDEAEVESDLDQGHDDHDDHGHGHDESGQTHSDFSARYLFSCEAIDNLKQVEVKLFAEFEGLEEIKVQVITSDNQSLNHLTPVHSMIDL